MTPILFHAYTQTGIQASEIYFSILSTRGLFIGEFSIRGALGLLIIRSTYVAACTSNAGVAILQSTQAPLAPSNTRLPLREIFMRSLVFLSHMLLVLHEYFGISISTPVVLVLVPLFRHILSFFWVLCPAAALRFRTTNLSANRRSSPYSHPGRPTYGRGCGITAAVQW
jgi:hypothetical protein